MSEVPASPPWDVIGIELSKGAKQADDEGDEGGASPQKFGLLACYLLLLLRSISNSESARR